MNTQISKHQRYKSIIRVMDNHPEALEGKTEIINAKTLFVKKDNRIEELITVLVPPVSIFYGPKRETLTILRQKIKRMTGLGILIAQKHNDLLLLQTMKAYKSLAYKTTAYKLYENAMKVADAIEQFAEDAVGFGFSNEEIELFRTVVTNFGEILAETGNKLNDRKANRNEIITLFKDCNKLLKENFDPFAIFVSEIYPEFFREYSLLRVGAGRRKSTNSSNAELGEISGTVTESNTGLPLQGVTVTIPGHDLVTLTDEDGYYLFEDLVTGTYRITCSLAGYQIPGEQKVEIKVDITSFDVDFSLEAVETANVENAA
jgi:hypothetical protein